MATNELKSRGDVALSVVALWGVRLERSFGDRAVKNASLLEIQRLAVCAMMYKNLGRLMEKYSDTPARVEDFYDMNYIRDGAAAPPEDVPPPVTPPVP